jgi:CheY-like chemotaxis protein
MTTSYRVLAVGGDRAVLVGLARAFQSLGSSFAALADPARLVESAAQFAPHAVLVFSRPSPDEASRSMARLRADARFAATPIVLVASLPLKDARGASTVMPDPSDVGEFSLRIVKYLQGASTPPAPRPSAPASAAGPAPAAMSSAPPASAAREEKAPDRAAASGPVPRQPARILLVDDDPALVKLFAIAMKRSGYEVVTASDGEEGLQQALEVRPDLVVADLNMPRLDGWGLLRALRADHRLGETPVMFLSCHDDYRESLKALSAGAQDYVAKGGKLDSMVSHLRTLLAPRDAFAAALVAGEGVSAKLAELGPQWALRKVAAAKVTGLLRAKDAFWSVRLAVDAGELVYAHAEIGRHQLDGIAALPPLVVLRAGELLFEPTAELPERNVQGALEPLLEEAALRNNRNESEALDKLLTRATRVEVDEQLFQLYEQLGPPGCREIAALVRQGLTPKEVIAKSDRSPTEIEETVRDLVRRRVLRLSA